VTREREQTLIHEAGHAFMAFAVGFPVHAIKLVRDETGAFGTSYTSPEGGADVAWPVCLVKVAGVVAEAIKYNGDSGLLVVEHFVRDSKDARTMREFLRTLAGPGMLLAPLLLAASHSTKYLQSHWDTLERFADELNGHGDEWIDPEPPIGQDRATPSWEEARRSVEFKTIAQKLSVSV
jgi:Peptidase M50B-like